MNVGYSEHTILTYTVKNNGFWGLKGELGWNKRDAIFVLSCFCCKGKLSLSQSNIFENKPYRRSYIGAEVMKYVYIVITTHGYLYL